MEESEKRRERLRTMRMEAAQANVDSYVETSLPNHLSNPLVDGSAAVSEQSEPCTAPRFDYYTNPMAAFSGIKKRGKIDNQIASDNYVPAHHNVSPATSVPSNLPGLRNPETSPSPTHQFHRPSPDQRMFYGRGFSGSGGHGSPMMPRPFPMDQGTPDIWSGPRRPFVNHFPGHPPRGMSAPRSPFVNHFPSHSHPPREMNYPSIVSGPRGNTYTNSMQDRVNYRSPSPSSGYQGSPRPGGGSHGYRGNMTPGSRWTSGRGVGSHGRGFSSNKLPRPEQFYDASMLEDPWKVLQAGIWRTSTPLNSSANPLESSILKSLGTKKARVSESSGWSSSQPSLAEYLAASFKEAVNDAPSE